MRIAILLALTSTTAAAETTFKSVGLGTSYAASEPGWMLRTEVRNDRDRDGAPLFGARIGLELWRSASHTGFSVPYGVYWGGKADDVRMTLGMGLGLWNVERHERRTYHGVAPFASASIELHREHLVISLDMRASRSIVSDAADFNIYSLILMIGKAGR